MNIILQNLKSIIITLLVIAFCIIVYLNSKKIVTWFTNIFTKVKTDDLPTTQDLKNPEYKIDSKIIKNYVDKIDGAVGRLGTDEKALDEVFQNLKSTSIENTVAVWNEFNSRNHNYSKAIGDYEAGIIFGEKLNLYEVLKSELTGLFASQSEKNCWVNWDWLLRKRAKLV